MITAWPDRGRADAATAALLLILTGVIFNESILDPGTIPAGLDLLQHYSRETAVRRAIDAGTFPLWNPYEFSGFPLQADIQTGVFYPPSVILRALPLPSFLTWTIVFHVWLFGVGGYVLCRYLGIRREIAAVAAIALMFSGIALPRVYAGHLDVLRTVAWVPLALALAFRSIDRARLRPDCLVVIVLACQLLGSFLQLAAYTFAAIAFYALFSALWPANGSRSWRHTLTVSAHLSLLVLTVVGLTAIQLLPTARLVIAAGRTAGVPYADAVLARVDWPAIVSFLTPSFAAAPIAPESWEVTAYVSIAIALLAPLALCPRSARRMVLFFVALACLTMAFASGGALYKLHHDVAPMFRIPGRLLVFWSISVAVLGALGWQWATGAVAPGDERKGRRLQILALLTVGVVVAIDAAAYARRYVEPRRFDSRFRQTVPVTPTPAGRVLSLCEARLHPAELAALGVPTIDAYNSYFLADYARLAALIRGSEAPDAMTAFPRVSGDSSVPDLAQAGLLNVTQVVSCERLEHESLRLEREDPPFFVYQNLRAAGRVIPDSDNGDRCNGSSADSSRAPVISSVIADTPRGDLRFVVSSASATSVLMSEPYYPERRAFVDDVETPVYKENVALSAICVPAGVHVVHMRYVPTSLLLGAALTALTITTWVGVAVWTRRRPIDVSK